MADKSGQTRVTHKCIPSPEEYQKLAQGLLAQFSTYYGSAKALGDRGLRAGFRRLLLEGTPPSPRLRKALDAWANVDILVIEAWSDTPIFGNVGLLDYKNMAALVIISLSEIDESLLIKCQACGRQTIKRAGNQRYCQEHSWTTSEGRRWHRQQRKENNRDG